MWTIKNTSVVAAVILGSVAVGSLFAPEHEAAAKGNKTDALTVEVQNARFISLPDVTYSQSGNGFSAGGGGFSGSAPWAGMGPVVSSSAPDRALGSTSASSDMVGPFYVIKGDIIRVNGSPASGLYVARGVLFSKQVGHQPHGVGQESVSVDIDGQGLLFGQGIAGRSTSPEGAVLGGTGVYEGAAGTYAGSDDLSKVDNKGFQITTVLTLTLKLNRH